VPGVIVAHPARSGRRTDEAPAALDPSLGALRVALDTNVVLALWHYQHPRLRALRAWLDARGAVLLTRADCLDELRRVLSLADFRVDPAAQAALLADYRARCLVLGDPDAEALAARAALPRCNDPEDQRFVELVVEGGAALLLTRDRQLLAMDRRLPGRAGPRVVTPERLMRWLRAREAP
jgi:uncharacterized protein